MNPSNFSVGGCIFVVKKVWSPFERGMFCNDKSISYPFTDHETISDTVLLLFGVAMPAVLVSWEDIPSSLDPISGSSWLWMFFG